jgi:sec-independent protein translocase protein TatA
LSTELFGGESGWYVAAMGDIGPMEIVMLLVLALLLFGAKRLPEIGRSLGTGMREFKDSVSGVTRSGDDVSSREQVLPPSDPG